MFGHKIEDFEKNVRQQAHVLVIRTARASGQECDSPNLSAASQASNHTMRRPQTYASFTKIEDIKSQSGSVFGSQKKLATDKTRIHARNNLRHTMVSKSRQSFNAGQALDYSATIALS